MWAPKYQFGLVKLDKLGAHMASGVLKLFATVKLVIYHQYLFVLS